MATGPDPATHTATHAPGDGPGAHLREGVNMAVFRIGPADVMRGHAATWERNAKVVTGYIRDNYQEHASWCRDVADGIDAGRVLPGEYPWPGSAGDFRAALLGGLLTPSGGEAPDA